MLLPDWVAAFLQADRSHRLLVTCVDLLHLSPHPHKPAGPQRRQTRHQELIFRPMPGSDGAGSVLVDELQSNKGSLLHPTLT